MSALAEFMFEAGQLKRVPRSGWTMAGVRHPESVAEHSFRAAVIGALLARLEGADPARTALLCVFHDAHEARVNDLHAVGAGYAPWGGVERKAAQAVVASVPEPVAGLLSGILQEFLEATTPEARLAHDADLLECLVQAREYRAQGYEAVGDWVRNCHAALRSDAARQLASEVLETDPNEWWRRLDTRRAPDP